MCRGRGARARPGSGSAGPDVVRSTCAHSHAVHRYSVFPSHKYCQAVHHRIALLSLPLSHIIVLVSGKLDQRCCVYRDPPPLAGFSLVPPKQR